MKQSPTYNDIDLQSDYSFAEFSLFDKALDGLPEASSILINTINQYSFCIANEDDDFKASLKGSDVLLPDGVAVVAAEFLLTGKKIKKIAGADLHHHLLEDLEKKGGSCFYLGASDKTLEKIKNKMRIEFPNVKVGSYSPPFKKVFSAADNADMIGAVNEFKPDVLFVGMTAPKQEKWAFQNKPFLDVKIICTVGAVFDFYAGTIKRPNSIWIMLGLEWLGRLLNEPKRLWRRYLYYGPIFAWLIAKAMFKQTFRVERSNDLLQQVILKRNIQQLSDL